MPIEDYTKEDLMKKTRDALENKPGVRKKVLDYLLCLEYALCRDYHPDGKCKKERRSCKYAQINRFDEVRCEHFYKDKNMFGGNRLASP